MNFNRKKLISWVIPTVIDLINFSCIGSCWQVLELFKVVKVGLLHVLLMLIMYLILLYKNHKTVGEDVTKHLKIFGYLTLCAIFLYSTALLINYLALPTLYYNGIIIALLTLLLVIVHYTFRYVWKRKHYV